jgi:Protein of unknown function (DUF3619)
MNLRNRARRADLDALQSRVGLRLAARLNERELPHDITERLRVARVQAMARAHHARAASPSAAGATMLVSRGSVALGLPTSWWLRLASLTPLVMLVLGLFLIQQLHEQAEIHAAAEIDSALLADDLPPQAYGDPGFVAFLNQPEP